jgi:hypothetical protein
MHNLRPSHPTSVPTPAPIPIFRHSRSKTSTVSTEGFLRAPSARGLSNSKRPLILSQRWFEFCRRFLSVLSALIG